MSDFSTGCGCARDTEELAAFFKALGKFLSGYLFLLLF